MQGANRFVEASHWGPVHRQESTCFYFSVVPSAPSCWLFVGVVEKAIEGF